VSSRPLQPVQSIPPSLWAGWVDFWFRPSGLQSLHALRVLFGLIALLWLLPLAGQIEAFFGLQGWYDTAAIQQAAELPSQPVGAASWSPIYLVADNPPALHAFYWSGIVVIVLFALGFMTRLTGVLSWMVVISFTTNPLLESDADVFLRMLAFYLMLGYLFAGLLRNDRPVLTRLLAPFDHWLLTRERDQAQTSSAATFAVRLLQIHFAFALVMLALLKLQLAEWWGGVTYWYPLTRPSEINLDTLQAWTTRPNLYLSLLSLAAYGVLAWQLAFPFFAWRRGQARGVLLLGGVIGCIGLITLYHQPLMGPLFLVLCLAYVSSEEWQRLLAGRLTRED
jgi:hypothetical protein